MQPHDRQLFATLAFFGLAVVSAIGVLTWALFR